MAGTKFQKGEVQVVNTTSQGARQQGSEAKAEPLSSFSIGHSHDSISAELQGRAYDNIRSNPHERLSLAVSLPLCPALDLTCGAIAVASTNSKMQEEYTAAVINELQSTAALVGDKRELCSLQVIGASANCLSDLLLGQIFSTITEHFDVTPQTEFSFELDPRRASRSQLTFLRGLGVNELKLQVRDMHPSVQNEIGRYQSAEMLEDVINVARELEYQSVGADQLFGMPGQTPETLASSIDLLVSLGVDWIECHPFVKREKRFPHQAALTDRMLPSLTDKLVLYNQLSESLLSSGYSVLGLSTFARPDHKLAVSRLAGKLSISTYGFHNHPQAWVLGVGLGAISELPEMFIENAQRWDDWHEHAQASELRPRLGLLDSNNDVGLRYLLRQLLCNQGVPAGRPALEKRLRPLIDLGVLEQADQRLQITAMGQDWLPVYLSDSSPAFRCI